MPVEVQFRTHKMHYIAEYGFAAHWKYKEKLSNEDEWLDKVCVCLHLCALFPCCLDLPQDNRQKRRCVCVKLQFKRLLTSLSLALSYTLLHCFTALLLIQEVQYKKWLTMHKLGVHDQKVRPSGAPLQDCALKSLGVHLLHGAEQVCVCVQICVYLRVCIY